VGPIRSLKAILRVQKIFSIRKLLVKILNFRTPDPQSLIRAPARSTTIAFATVMKKTSTKQLSLFKKETRRFFGGQLLHNKRKSRRPFSRKHSMHIVLRSRWARGENSFLRARNKKAIENIIRNTARKYAVKLYQFAIVGNHLHLVVLCFNKEKYHAFISVISGLIASHVMHQLSFKNFAKYFAMDCCPKKTGGGPNLWALNEEPVGLDQQFWDFRPFSRILYWGKDFKFCCGYVKQNFLEAIGFIDYKPRTNPYAKWLRDPLPIMS
jgi:REP element-mobilizing transposase RayT